MTRGRPGKVDKDTVLEALKAGKNDTEIAEAQDCQRQYIQYLRRRWEREGKLPTRAKFQRRAGITIVSPTKTRARMHNDVYLWTELEEALLRVVLQAKKTEELIEENWRLQNQVASLNDALAKKDKDLHSSREYELLIKQGVLPAPLRAKKPHNSTYHIDCAPQECVFDLARLPDIKEAGFSFPIYDYVRCN